MVLVVPTFQKSPAAGLIMRMEGCGTISNFSEIPVKLPSVTWIVTLLATELAGIVHTKLLPDMPVAICWVLVGVPLSHCVKLMV